MQTTENIVVIGASAGGVPALRKLIAALPSDLNAAVFVVLHISPHSPSGLQSILQRITSIPVIAATEDQSIQPGRIYVGVTDRHLVIEKGFVRATRGPRECRMRPAIDVLFRSAAVAYGTGVIGVVLSGALDDGTAGLWSVKNSGGVALVQDPATAEYASMPQSAIHHVDVDVDAVLPLVELAHEIVKRTRAQKERAVAEQAHLQKLGIAIGD